MKDYSRYTLPDSAMQLQVLSDHRAPLRQQHRFCRGLREDNSDNRATVLPDHSRNPMVDSWGMLVEVSMGHNHTLAGRNPGNRVMELSDRNRIPVAHNPGNRAMVLPDHSRNPMVDSWDMLVKVLSGHNRNLAGRNPGNRATVLPDHSRNPMVDSWGMLVEVSMGHNHTLAGRNPGNRVMESPDRNRKLCAAAESMCTIPVRCIQNPPFHEQRNRQRFHKFLPTPECRFRKLVHHLEERSYKTNCKTILELRSANQSLELSGRMLHLPPRHHPDKSGNDMWNHKPHPKHTVNPADHSLLLSQYECFRR